MFGAADETLAYCNIFMINLWRLTSSKQQIEPLMALVANYQGTNSLIA